MIVLNNAKELVRVETWGDIQERPGFTDNLDPSAHELSAIIGQYAFADKIHCGLSNCHTPHSRGYLVATKSEQETNIGKDCGKNYFGVDFETMATQFDRDMRDKEARERLWSFSFKLDELKASIKARREGEFGADWVYRMSHQLLDQGKLVPAVVRRRISIMLKTGDSRLTIEHEATAQEYEMEEVRTGRPAKRPMVVSDKVADIRGLEALTQANDLRQILVLDLEEKIKVFEPLNIALLTSKELSTWSKWCGTVEQKLEAASQSLQIGLTLLTKQNLEPFMRLITEEGDHRSFKKYLNGIP
jgi:hypothetical protein